MIDWTVRQARDTYNIAHWGNGYFDIDEQGHVARFVVRRTDVTEARPHGLSYSLTLHDRSEVERILRMDEE